ncbi:MAG: hypothetical protein K2X66_11635 [Cyanobacteria bacterium]|nr:hypothetical protein [Cyanobacteriota bacterium]
MFRIIFTLTDILSTFFVFLAPLAVIHWLVAGFHPPGTEGFVNFFVPIFTPLNRIIENLTHGLFPIISFGLLKSMPMLKAGNEFIPITQGLLSLFFTVLFFTFSFLSQIFRSLDISANNAAEILRFRTMTEAKQSEVDKTKRKVSGTSRIWVYISYPFFENPKLGEIFNSYIRTGGKLVQAFPKEILVEFDTIENVMRYCKEATREIMSYYSTLRPIDPQPPYKISVHAIQPSEDNHASIEKCRLMVQNALNNSVVFSINFKELMEARELHKSYKFHSTGFHEFSGGYSLEVFRLEL